MTETGSHHPAVLAGLMGSAIWAGAPTVALASPVDDVVDAVSGSLLLQFVVGCAIGAAVAGVISFVADRIAKDDDYEDEDIADDQELAWTSSSLNLIAAQDEVGEDDPTGDLGRYRTGQITIDFPALGEQVVAQAISGPRHFAPAAERRPEKHAPRRAGRHFAGAAKKAEPTPTEKASEPILAVAEAIASVAPVAAAAPRKGRHFAGAAPVVKEAVAQVVETAKDEALSPEKNEVAPVVSAEAPLPSKAPVAAGELHGRARLAALPVIESRRAPVRTPNRVIAAAVPEVAVPAVEAAAVAPEVKAADTADLGRVVTNQRPVESAGRQGQSKHAAHRQSGAGITGRLRMQMAARAKGVRAVLAERLGRDALDGVPIIERADGTTVEVTPTWFDQTVVPALASITGVTPRLEDTATRMGETTGTLRVETDEPSRASYIAHRVAEVNVGIFPERRTADELEHDDVWEEALAAMGETIAQNNPTSFDKAPVFQDVVGGPSTIDDPDGLEGPTGFIPFRVPAAHPEVVDTETYVDYLLRDEISQNGSPVLSRSPHAHLRVIEGGTGKLRTRRRAEDTGSVKQGRHFAQPAYAAAEA